MRKILSKKMKLSTAVIIAIVALIIEIILLLFFPRLWLWQI